LIRTCPAPGLGISRSTIWKSAPGLETCAAFIVATATVVVAIKSSYEFSAIVEKSLPATGLRRQELLARAFGLLLPGK
jgi:hypothetical protein